MKTEKKKYQQERKYSSTKLQIHFHTFDNNNKHKGTEKRKHKNSIVYTLSIVIKTNMKRKQTFALQSDRISQQLITMGWL